MHYIYLTRPHRSCDSWLECFLITGAPSREAQALSHSAIVGGSGSQEIRGRFFVCLYIVTRVLTYKYILTGQLAVRPL